MNLDAPVTTKSSDMMSNHLHVLPEWACPDWYPWRWRLCFENMMVSHPVFFPKRDAVLIAWEWYVDLKKRWLWLLYFPHLLYLITYLPVTCRWSLTRRGYREQEN